MKKKNKFLISMETYECGDGCCYNTDFYLSINGKRVEYEYEEYGKTISLDRVFSMPYECYSYICEYIYNLKIGDHDNKWSFDTFNNGDFDYIIKENVKVLEDEKNKEYKYQILSKNNKYSDILFDEIEEALEYIITNIYKDKIL